ncbi:MAG: DUF2334 domain-containing protein [Oscillospiraceae bacterium]|nr:DUF2334 domain-containing protein [Oscillospiraceae bacterium]
MKDLITKTNGQDQLSQTGNSVGNDQAAEILIVYPDDLDDAERNSLCRVVETMTYLGHTADYLPDRKAVLKLSQYSAVVCYALKDDSKTETALMGYSGRVLLLGCLPETLPDPKRYPRTVILSGKDSAVAAYTFSGGNTFTQLLALEGLRLPQNPTYTAGTLSASTGEIPLAEGWGLVRYLPMTDYTTAFARAVLEQETTLWLWPYHDKPHSYAQFIVLDSVYPFTDPQRLLSIVQKLVREKINFVISVMPIYQNADYPAMRQFCEVLRYAQANGGAVIMHAPMVQGDLDPQVLQQKLTDAAQNYFKNQVYPVALEIPRAWMYRENLRSTLGRYRTLFVYEDGTAGECLDLKLATNDFIRLGAQLIPQTIGLDTTGTGYLDCRAGAVYLSSSEDPAQVLKAVSAVRNSTVPLKSLWDMSHTEYFNESGLLTWDGSALKVNGEKVSLNYIPKPYEENHNYKRTVLYRATANLQNQNHVLIVFVAVAMAAFALCMYLARRQMHLRFFYSDVEPLDDNTPRK